MTPLEKRLRSAVGEFNGLTRKQLDEHVRGVAQVVTKARNRTRSRRKAK